MSTKNTFDLEELDTDTPNPAARKVVTKSPYRSVGILACSWRQDQAIEYESQLERRFLMQALLLPMVRKVVHQPFRLEYTEQQKTHTYVPDFLIHLADGTKVVIEIKPTKFLKRHLHKLQEAQRILSEKGVPFLVVTEKEIDDGIKIENVGLVLRYARGSIEEDHKQRCLATLRAKPNGMRMDELRKEAQVSKSDIFHLVGRSDLSIDLSEPIIESSIVHFPRKEQHDYLHFIGWFDTAPGHAIARVQEGYRP